MSNTHKRVPALTNPEKNLFSLFIKNSSYPKNSFSSKVLILRYKNVPPTISIYNKINLHNIVIYFIFYNPPHPFSFIIYLYFTFSDITLSFFDQETFLNCSILLE